MMHARVLLTCLLVVQTSAQAQSSDLLSILVSQGYSIFTSITAGLGQTTANTLASTPTILATSNFPSITPSESITPSATSAQITPSTSAPTDSSLASITSPATSASPVSGSGTRTPAATSASTSATSTASTASAAEDNGGNHRDRNLAIILGTVLGALALGLLILLVLLLCRRRRRRAYGRHGSLSSNSDEALAGRKAPIAAANTSQRRSLLRHNNARNSQMSEHSHYDVPSAHQFGNRDSVPFIPTGGANRSTGVVPTNAETGVGGNGHLRDGTGLNNHPYHDNNHHTKAALAAGAGGAALGAAAARHSRSTERQHEPRLSGHPGIHPAYWDEPPPRSLKRDSVDSARRSGSMPRGTFYGPQDHAGSPLKSSMSGTAAGGAAGMATGLAAAHAGRRSHDRGRSFGPDVSQPNGYYTNTSPAISQGVSNMVPGSNHSPANVTSYPPVPPSGHGHVHSHDQSHGAVGPAIGAAAAGVAMAKHNRSRSRSGPNPPLPPSLVVGGSNHRRNLPSRSPKRTRFSNGHTYHDAMPYNDDIADNNAISPPTTAKSSSFNNRMSANSAMTDELVSPISLEEQRGDVNQYIPTPSNKRHPPSAHRNRSFSPNRREHMSDSSPPTSVSPQPLGSSGLKPNQHIHSHDLSPPSSVSPQPHGSLPPTVTTTTTTTIRPTPTPHQDSGLLNAVSDHFDSNTTSTTQHHPLLAPAPIHPSAFSHPDAAMNKPLKPVSRKPVPFSEYNNARPAYNDGFGPQPGQRRRSSGTRESRPSGENWWRGEEDSAWQQTYSHPHLDPNQQEHQGIVHAR